MFEALAFSTPVLLPLSSSRHTSTSCILHHHKRTRTPNNINNNQANHAMITISTTITMRKSNNSNKKSAPSNKNKNNNNKRKSTKFSKETQQELQKVASKYGVVPPRPGDRLDSKFTSAKSKQIDMEQRQQEGAFYNSLIRLIGKKQLDTIETSTYFILAFLLLAFITSGLAIASEAFFKASQKEIPPILDGFVNNVEQAFTPVLVIFLILSSILGVYKQAQLNAGAAQYDETKGKQNQSR